MKLETVLKLERCEDEAEDMALGKYAKTNPRVQYIQCGCSRRYEPRDFLNLKLLGIQKDAGFAGGDLLLANCSGCGSTLALEVTPDRWWECDTRHEHSTREERDACDAQELAEDKAAHPMDYEATE